MAGTYIRLDSPVCLGDYMKLERDNERCYADRLVVNEHSNSFQQHCVRPHARLGTTAITNCSTPESQMSLLVCHRVRYHSDPEKVEQTQFCIPVAMSTLPPGAIEAPYGEAENLILGCSWR